MNMKHLYRSRIQQHFRPFQESGHVLPQAVNIGLLIKLATVGYGSFVIDDGSQVRERSTDFRTLLLATHHLPQRLAADEPTVPDDIRNG